ncbi:MAG: RNA 2',3'-cyclic phosphodiesterase [Ktedonobacteraceae bacterium]|nr:RNA 2',3'-cyclic phosphodiesterase [Ktedonobacteraceae bacterium]
MTRTFIALEMNETLQGHLARVIRQVAQVLPRLNWVNPASIHLTLAFLGELDPARLEQAMQATEAAARQVRPFSYHLTRVGIFGSPRQPRVVWMGIEERSGSLSRLHRILNQELEQRSFETEDRPFSPHFTLARVKHSLSSDEVQRLQDILTGKQHGLVSPDEYPVQYINVMKSELLRSGAQYTCLKAYPLD